MSVLRGTPLSGLQTTVALDGMGEGLADSLCTLCFLSKSSRLLSYAQLKTNFPVQ